MNEEWSQIAANAVANAAQMAQAAWQEAAESQRRPSAVFRPRLSVDGDQWCALYGDNLQDGVAGFGDSPADAMWDFDRSWAAKLPGTKADSRVEEVLRSHGFPELRAV